MKMKNEELQTTVQTIMNLHTKPSTNQVDFIDCHTPKRKDNRKRPQFEKDKCKYSEEEWKTAMAHVIGQCVTATHYRSSLYPSSQVLDSMLKEYLKINSTEEEEEYQVLFRKHIHYLKNDMVNRRGKWSNQIRKSFWAHSKIPKPENLKTTKEKSDFADVCSKIRDKYLEVKLDGRKVYHWHRGPNKEPFNSKLIVRILGVTYSGCAFSYKATDQTRLITVTVDQLAFCCYTIERIISKTPDVTLSKEQNENSKGMMEWRNQILEVLHRECTREQEPYWLLERVKVTVPKV